MNLKFFQMIALMFFCLVIAGPEFGVGLELLVLVDAFGIELIFLSLSASLWNHWNYLVAKLEQLDPYFFLSSSKDIMQCPALIAHAIPGSMALFMYVLAFTAVSV